MDSPIKTISGMAFGLPAVIDVYDDHLHVRTHSKKYGDRNLEYNVRLSILEPELLDQIQKAQSVN